MKIKKILAVLIFVSLLIILSILIFNKSKQVSSSSKLQVSASFYPMYFFASQIGGTKVDVTNITPAGAEPHDYDLTAQDIIKIQNSKLVVLNGSV